MGHKPAKKEATAKHPEGVESFTADDGGTRRVEPSVDGPSTSEVERRATAELVADTFNGLHQRTARIERLLGIEEPKRDADTIITATDRGDLA